MHRTRAVALELPLPLLAERGYMYAPEAAEVVVSEGDLFVKAQTPPHAQPA